MTPLGELGPVWLAMERDCAEAQTAWRTGRELVPQINAAFHAGEIDRVIDLRAAFDLEHEEYVSASSMMFRRALDVATLLERKAFAETDLNLITFRAAIAGAGKLNN